LEAEKTRLTNFKQQKGKRLDELEAKVQRYEFFQKVDVERLIATMTKMNTQIETLKSDHDAESKIHQTRVMFSSQFK
jgi:hypothetical protein